MTTIRWILWSAVYLLLTTIGDGEFHKSLIPIQVTLSTRRVC
ncbi:hypothetical protein Plhal304r1_c024g0082931 [Plasmopara halstedii]